MEIISPDIDGDSRIERCLELTRVFNMLKK